MGFVLLLLLISYIIIHRDAKSIKQYKHKTTDLIRQLEQSVQRNEALITSRKKAVHTITHELRTPLTVIGGNAELLLNDTEADNRMRHAQTIGDAAGRMAGMINNLLVYFRLDSGKETPSVKPFKLRSIAETLETEFAPLAEDKRLAFRVEDRTDEIVNGDRNRILSIGSNLLSNAVKFTQKGTITLKAQYKDGIFTLIVEDTGTGTILAKIQILMLQQDIERMQTAPNFSLDASDGVYIVFLIIGIVGYFTIPTVAGWIIQAGGGIGSYNKNIGTAGALGGSVAGAAAGNVAGRAGKLIKGTAGKVFKR